MQSSPFTEMPEELKRKRFSFGKLVRGFFNTLFLVALGLSLMALILAFGYQMIYNPEVLEEWANKLITPVAAFLQSVLPAGE